MAIHRLPIIGFGTLPDTSGVVFFESYSVKATNKVWIREVCIFDAGNTRNGIHGGFQVPQNYVGSANLIIPWTAIVTSGDVEWDLDYRAVAAGESLDQTGNDESVNLNDLAPSAINELQVLSIALTDTNFVVGDEVEYEFFRDQVDTGDTMSGAAILFGLYFEYADA